jgi:hypothetical protein
MSRRTAVLDHPGLWDLPEPEPEPEPAPKPKSRRRHVLDLPRPSRDKDHDGQDCAPTCLTCGKPEGQGLCHAPSKCAIVCARTNQPSRAEVCIITTRVTATPTTGTRKNGQPAHRIAWVLCPECGQVHWHGASYGARVRVGQCGAVYVVHLNRPRITAAGVTP